MRRIYIYIYNFRDDVTLGSNGREWVDLSSGIVCYTMHHIGTFSHCGLWPSIATMFGLQNMCRLNKKQ